MTYSPTFKGPIPDTPPAKILELLRIDNGYVQKLDELRGLDAKARGGDEDAWEASVALIHAVGRVNRFAEEALLWMVPEPEFRQKREDGIIGVGLEPDASKFTWELRRDGKTIAATFEARNRFGGWPRRRGPIVHHRPRGFDEMDAWRKYRPGRPLLAATTAWRDAPEAFRRRFERHWAFFDGSSKSRRLTVVKGSDFLAANRPARSGNHSLAALERRLERTELRRARFGLLVAIPPFILNKGDVGVFGKQIARLMVKHLPKKYSVLGGDADWDAFLFVVEKKRSGSTTAAAVKEFVEQRFVPAVVDKMHRELDADTTLWPRTRVAAKAAAGTSMRQEEQRSHYGQIVARVRKMRAMSAAVFPRFDFEKVVRLSAPPDDYRRVPT